MTLFPSDQRFVGEWHTSFGKLVIEPVRGGLDGHYEHKGGACAASRRTTSSEARPDRVRLLLP
ncbi:hypothetical protein ACMHYB_24555 [Sorangium sp. So ce1128]